MIHTASEGITLAKKLENDSAKFYEELAQRNTKDAETFLSFAKENKKNIAQIQRTYYGVITDAIEGCFAFNLDPEDYLLSTSIPKGAKYTDILGQALLMEETIITFYTEAAEQSQNLMADVPRLFTLIARKRETRTQKLKELLSSGA